jgi:hypothetical protein
MTKTYSLIIFLLILPCSLLAAPDIVPGEWEITSTMEMPGMAYTMPATKFVQCITEKDLIPQSQQQNDKCDFLDQSINGNTVKWTVKCESGGGTMTSQGSITYFGDHFDGTIETRGSQIPSGMTQTMKGKRLGNCSN